MFRRAITSTTIKKRNKNICIIFIIELLIVRMHVFCNVEVKGLKEQDRVGTGRYFPDRPVGTGPYFPDRPVGTGRYFPDRPVDLNLQFFEPLCYLHVKARGTPLR